MKLITDRPSEIEEALLKIMSKKKLKKLVGEIRKVIKRNTGKW